MSMVIANNMQAINTKRQFATSSRGMSGAMEKLSSGYKINTGKDDPAGLLISEKLRSQINGLKRAQQNTEEAINVMGIAEGALNEMNSILKKMKALAIHSANTGVTSPDQIAADQAEMDSAIQTLDRIAQTTKFSDQNLLNGSKDITYDQDTLIKGTQQNALLNTRESSFSQIYKRDGYAVSINFTGTKNADAATGIGDVDFSQQAMKAYLEVDTAFGAQPQPDIDANGYFTKDQAFTLTGNKGSRSFKFKVGASVTDMVAQIKSAADSTGIDAALVFNSAQRIDKASQGSSLTTVDQYSNITGLAAKNNSAPVTLQFSGSVSGANIKDMSYTVTVGVSSGGQIQYTVVTDDGGVATLTMTSGGVLQSGAIAGGAYDGINIKGFNNIDLSKQVIFSGTMAGGALNSGAGKGSATNIDLSGLSASAQKQLAGASNINMAVTAVQTSSGGAGTIKVTITGIDSDGKEFTLTSEQKMKSGANGPIEITTGALKGLTFSGVASGNLGAVMAGSVDLQPTYAISPNATIGSGKILSSQIDGKGNVSSLGTVGGVSFGSGATSGAAVRNAGDVAIFNNTISKDGTGRVEKGVTGIQFGTGSGASVAQAAASVVFGMNTDGQGRIYVKFLDDNSYELYKDASLSQESLVATGINGEEIKEANNSGLKGLTLNLAGENLASKNGVYIAFAGIEGTSLNTDGSGKEGVRYNGSVVGTPSDGTFSGKAMFDADKTLITGVELGKNTSDNGQIYLKNVYNHEDGTVQVFAYKHKDMRDEDMVAKSEVYNVRQMNSGGDFDYASGLTVVLNEIRNADNTAGTGLGLVLSVEGQAFANQKKSTTLEGSMTFTNLGARIYAQDYGSEGFIKVTQDKGAIFYEYGTAGDNSSKRLIEAGANGTTVQVNGQDATLSVNGGEVKTQGLRLKMANQDIQADLTFNEGKVGSTTLAQVGYGDGSIFTKIGALNLGSTDENEDGLSGLLCNAGHVTQENINDFDNGMQLQLGEGEGDQNRTIVAIKSMTADNLGRITKGGYWETGSAVWTERTFTMKDVMGGGLASLAAAPTLAMSIIDQAISDVSETRAQIGAMQTNLLQTNSNNLSVTMENIQKTESGIRDADMADEMTEFTKQQVLQSAAMSMMAQANQASQNVLQLLR